MEREEIELSSNEMMILDEMCFSLHFNDVRNILKDEESTYNCLLKLLDNKLIEVFFPSPDKEIPFDLQNFQEFYKDYYYLATKSGLKILFG